jgi:hypothetical protein
MNRARENKRKSLTLVSPLVGWFQEREVNLQLQRVGTVPGHPRRWSAEIL